ncbi:MAG: Dickkopf N-terminal cysteine-rich domain-containing protein, partial [Myxococcales bacterium]
MVCVSPGDGPMRCARACTASNTAEICGEGFRCYARQGELGATQGVCGKPAAEGEPCDRAAFVYCGSGTSCITPSAERSDGLCFRVCSPRAQSADCTEGRVCADPFSSRPETGICVPPIPRGERCDHAALRFCGPGELCARPGPDSWGMCHRRCAQDSDCTDGESCVEPSAGIRFCAQPVPRDGRCSATLDQYCGRGDICVSIGADNFCKQDCTASNTCAAGQTCSRLEGSDRKACL